MDDALALLRLQIEWGADEAIDIDPVERLHPADIKPPPPRVVGAPENRKDTPVERALAIAAQAGTLDELRMALTTFDGCALRDTASNLVFAEGNPASTTLIIGEPPGREEDRSGHPFAGPDGQLLDEMLISIGLTRADLMLTPLLPWRPPGGRPPSAAELTICKPFLDRLIVLLNPSRVMILGGATGRAIIRQPTTRLRGPRMWIEYSISSMHRALPTLIIPSFAEMRKTPALRREAWEGLRMLRRSIDRLPS